MTKATERTMEVAMEALEEIRKVVDGANYDNLNDYTKTVCAYHRLKNFVNLMKWEMENDNH